MVEMPKSKAPRIQVDPLSDVDIDRPFPRLGLTAAQWNEICELSDIPNDRDEARKSIEIALGMFRQFQAADLDRMPAAKIRKEFQSLAEHARTLYEQFSELMRNRDAYTATIGTPNFFSPLDRLSDVADHQASLSRAEAQRLWQEGHAHLSQIRDAFVGLPKWFLLAAYRVKDEKRGPKAGNVYWVVGNLDGIREQFTGKRITRSYKDDASVKYIRCVCKIADPNIERGTIDQAMRYRIRHRTVD